MKSAEADMRPSKKTAVFVLVALVSRFCHAE